MQNATRKSESAASDPARRKPVTAAKRAKLSVLLISGDDALWPQIGPHVGGDLVLKQVDSIDELLSATVSGQPAIVLWCRGRAGRGERRPDVDQPHRASASRGPRDDADPDCPFHGGPRERAGGSQCAHGVARRRQRRGIRHGGACRREVRRGLARRARRSAQHALDTGIHHRGSPDRLRRDVRRPQARRYLGQAGAGGGPGTRGATVRQSSGGRRRESRSAGREGGAGHARPALHRSGGRQRADALSKRAAHRSRQRRGPPGIAASR